MVLRPEMANTEMGEIALREFGGIRGEQEGWVSWARDRRSIALFSPLA
jgi:hypothetical protein